MVSCDHVIINSDNFFKLEKVMTKSIVIGRTKHLNFRYHVQLDPFV